MEMGPMRPRYMVAMITIRPAVPREAVSPRERPTVATALIASNSPSIMETGSKASSSSAETNSVKKLIITMAAAFCISSSEILRRNRVVSFRARA